MHDDSADSVGRDSRKQEATAGPPGPSRLRIGTADRQRAIDLLREHTSAGRLELEEFEERVGAAHAARTGEELDRLFGDLPPLPGSNPPSGRFSPEPQRWSRAPGWHALPHTGWAVVAAAVLALVALSAVASGGHVLFFPFWLIFVVAFAVRCRHRGGRYYGSRGAGRYGYPGPYGYPGRYGYPGAPGGSHPGPYAGKDVTYR